MLKIRRSHDRLIFNMGIPIPGKDGLYIETGPWLSPSRHESDSLWQKTQSTLASALQLSACRPMSYGIIKTSNFVDYMKLLVLHEMSHILGIYHDSKLSH